MDNMIFMFYTLYMDSMIFMVYMVYMDYMIFMVYVHCLENVLKSQPPGLRDFFHLMTPAVMITRLHAQCNCCNNVSW